MRDVFWAGTKPRAWDPRSLQLSIVTSISVFGTTLHWLKADLNFVYNTILQV